MHNDEMSISAFSRRSLLSIKALRLYDEMGLLSPNRIDDSSRYRYYGEAQLETARLISLLRKLDVPLAQIATIIGQDPADAYGSLVSWWRNEEAEMARRADLLKYIQTTLLDDSSAHELIATDYEIDVRDMPSTTWLYRSKHLHGPELPSFIGQSSRELTERAKIYGGATGDCTVIIHGVIDLDSDGPADVCVPIAEGSTAEGDDLIRQEHAHQEVFTVLRKHQVEFPQILRVYRTLRRWIQLNDYEISGPPREQYPGQFEADGTGECIVAFPILSAKGATP